MRGCWLALVTLGIVVGCTSSATVVCNEGRVCPGGNVCDDTHGLCVLPEQLTSCDGIADGEECAVNGTAFGNCRDSVCLRTGCGDRLRVDPEDCDGSVPTEQEACTAHGFHGGGVVTCTDRCTFNTSACTGYCGDGQISGPEVCDGQDVAGKDCTDFGFQSAAGLACSPACTFDVGGCAGFCGDNMKNGGELCDGSDLGTVDNCLDLGYHASGTVTCTAGCTYDQSQCTEYCGDGVRNGDEACDSADLAASTCIDFGYYNATTLGCSSACTFDTSLCMGYCGDGVISGPEDCEPGSPDNLGGATCTELGYYNSAGLACTSSCRFDDSQCTGFCGNRSPDGSEVCDGTAPASAESCTSFGFESGPMSCAALCAPDFSGCHTAAWQPTGALFTQAVRATLAFAPNNLYLAGDNGIRRWNGGVWLNELSDASIYGMWGSSPSDIFAVGANGAIRHWNGSSWSPMTSGTTKYLYGVWGSGPNDVFAVGDQLVLRWNGSTWDPTAMSDTLLGVWGTATDNVYAVGLNGARRWNGSSWTTPFSAGQTLRGVWGTGPNDVFMVGDNGSIRHYDGNTWATQSTPTSVALFSVWGSGPLDIYAVGSAGAILHYNGATWQSLISGTSDQLMTVGGSGASDVYTGGFRYASSDTSRHWDGGAWVTMAATTQQLDDVWGLPNGQAFAVGASGTLLKWDGTTWTAMASGTTASLTGVWASAANNLYVTTATGEVRRYDGNQWTVETTHPGVLNAIWGTGTELFAAGNSGKVLHYNGATWTTYTMTTTSLNYDVWGSSSSDVYVVGGSPASVHRWNGSAWVVPPVGPSLGSSYLTVWGSGPKDIYIGGDGALLKHYDGTQWSGTVLDSPNSVTAVWGTGPADVYAFLQYEVRHFDGFRWSRQLQSTITSVTNAWGYNDVFAVGAIPSTLLRRPQRCEAIEFCSNGKDDDCDGLVDCSDPFCGGLSSCTSGGACMGWSSLACNTTINGSTLTGGTRLTQYSCDPWLEHGREQIYRVAPSQSGTVNVTMSSPGKDLDLIVLGETAIGSCEPRSTGCIGASSTTSNESVTFTAQGGNGYFIVVDGFGTDAGAFTLQVTCP